MRKGRSVDPRGDVRATSEGVDQFITQWPGIGRQNFVVKPLLHAGPIRREGRLLTAALAGLGAVGKEKVPVDIDLIAWDAA
jgi:hypothetical protein